MAAQKTGQWFWLPDEHEGFIPVKLMGSTGSSKSYKTEGGRVVEAKEELDELDWNELENPLDDLVQMMNVNDGTILHTLRQRFLKDKIYTCVGSILISVNPFKRLALYSEDLISTYNDPKQPDLPPHVYTVAQTAYKSMIDSGKDNALLISGESGAGKTEATKTALHFFCDSCRV
eukprot:Rmarinus@m.6383